MNVIEIELLADHPEVIPILVNWFEREWEPYYGPEGTGSADQDLRASCKRQEMPITLVAECDGEICGTASLKAESVSTHTHLTPWLAALLVGPKFRRSGVGEQLIAAIENLSRRLGFRIIYVGTREGSGTPESAIRKRGWEFIEKGTSSDSEVSIFRKAL